MTDPSYAPDWLTTSDVATLRKWSRWTARRWLLRVGQRCKGAVRADGRGLRIRRDAYRRLVEAEDSPRTDPEIVRRIEELESLARLLDLRSTRHGEALAKLHAL